ncbi:DUF5522 domain-containing protein [Deminuibacter soli]|uniref:DUF5522 domain-containing protein n=1 Tax=Deminuibacter soli TaxID=2291815 RepID=UPI001FEC0E37|nr:DUF5522 domain-containing protein [Deminuibacter soli]
MSNSLTEHIDYYLNAQGLMVFTAHYHLQRGYCCGNGCLHCPYNYEAVPEPKRSEMQQRRAAQQDQQSR